MLPIIKIFVLSDDVVNRYDSVFIYIWTYFMEVTLNKIKFETVLSHQLRIVKLLVKFRIIIQQ